MEAPFQSPPHDWAQCWQESGARAKRPLRVGLRRDQRTITLEWRSSFSTVSTIVVPAFALMLPLW